MSFSAIVIGNESLLIQCSEILLQRGHTIAAVVSRNPDIRSWALQKGLRVEAQDGGLAERLGGVSCDWLFSIANLSVIPDAVLSLAQRGAVNFHDGPLPRYAGLNAPVWAVLNREPRFGITWHLITGGIDEGDILEQRMFDLTPSDTALTVNTKCYEAAMASFPALVAGLESGAPKRKPQDLTQRSYFGRADRPAAQGRIDFAQTAGQVAALVRALDHGGYRNPLTCPKILAGDRVLLVGEATEVEASGAPGTVLEVSEAGLVIACAQSAVRLARITDTWGASVCPRTVAALGAVLASPDAAEALGLTEALAAVLPGEARWRRALTGFRPATFPGVKPATGDAPDWAQVAVAMPPAPTNDALLVTVSAFVARMAGQEGADLAFQGKPAPAAPGYLSDWVPLTGPDTGMTLAQAQTQLSPALDAARKYPSFPADLIARDPALRGFSMPAIGLSECAAPIRGTALTFAVTSDGLTLHHDRSRLSTADARRIAARLAHMAAALDPKAPIAAQPILPESERQQVLYDWNATAAKYDATLCVHQAFEAQVRRTPDAVALVCDDTSLSYADLNARANRLAHVLRSMGVGPGTLVGLFTQRGPDLLVGALAIQKAGGAYVPLDPAYPADRIALYIEDSAAPVILAQSALIRALPPHAAQVLAIDSDPRIGAATDTNPDSGVSPSDLAYMIYTSGSTGKPKGVMVEHRNVANFFTGMDARLRHDPPGVWLAVTSLSFDISVLELFWTLARGFKLVLISEENRGLVSGARLTSAQKMDFSLYYWGNDDGAGPKKYELLLEGAKFADTHGFCAVWTPERHFHAFGGPYPNPSITGAAVAAVTRNIGVRAGSCVAPLHHPARIAEEWAVIDNLTNGRAGLAFASGWQPDDFVLRPENTPPNNKAAMFTAIDQVRRLWRGEPVEFPTATGTPFAVVTQPRPVSANLPVWVTTAGNPETWKEAGQIGANVLTHLLGQSVDEVAGKIKIYHQALRDAGYNPAEHSVTLMLHTYVARDRDQARTVARGPMKDYLRAAAGLIKQYAWAFPAFKKPQGVTNPMEIDLRTLTGDELEGILDFAFQRYFDDSGLFGTVEDCLDRVEQLKRIGVNEVACLIDYGIAVDQVMEGLYPLAEVVRRANSGGVIPADDFSIAAQIRRHGVTHLQCTPSMARMITMNDEARASLGQVSQLMIGGEALPGALVADLRRATDARIENMYGPTETTIWSSTETVDADEAVINIGRPIANTRMYVLDAALNPVPVGVPGELFIAGCGVTRGYWQRPDLTAAQFLPDPFVEPGGPEFAARMYRTGDLVRWRGDGKIDFLGRHDHQVKIRGYRIELGEIEAMIEAQLGIHQAVVLAREDTPGDVRLVAYVTGEGTAPAPGLRARLARLLPAHMVPAHVVPLEAFPLTPNRKIDRKALPAPHGTPQEASRVAALAPAQGSLQVRIAEIWARILGVPQVGAKDNFFALGGHSLLAVQAHREMRDTLGATSLSITDIFRFPTLAALAAHMGESHTVSVSKPDIPVDPSSRAAGRADAMAQRRALRATREQR